MVTIIYYFLQKEKTSNNGAEVLNKKNNDSVCNGQQLQESSANPDHGKNGEKNSKIIIYYCDEYLAIRNEQNSFFICRAQHNIYQNGRKIRIKWFSNDQDPNIYRPDFDDYIDFECILTNLSVKRERDGVSLPESEKNRALNILRRALDVEKGINSPPDPRKVLSDGMDISIIGKVKEEDVLSKIKQDHHNGGGIKKKTKSTKPSATAIVDDNPAKNNGTSTSTNDDENIRTPTISNDSKQKRSKKAKIEVKNEKLNETSLPSPTISTSKNTISNATDQNDKIQLPIIKSSLSLSSTHQNSKLLIQAIQTDDYEFLEKLTGQQKNPDLNLYSISKPCSISNRKNAIHLAIEREDLKSLRLLMEIEKNIKDDFNYQLPNDSIELDHCELIIDRIDYEKCKHCQFPLDKSYVRFGLKQNVKFNFIEKILPFCKNSDNLLEIFDDNIILTGLKCGNYEQIILLIEKICQTTTNAASRNFQKFLQILNSSKEENDQKSLEEEYLINEQLQLYPIHIAAINPDPFIFYHLTNIRPDQIYQNDCQQWMPIHYASVCQTFFNLKHLLNLGVSARQCDWKGNTPLHLATKYNRIQNVNLIIQYESSQCNIIPSLFQTYNRKGLTAFHLACKKGFIEIVRLFIENRIQIDFATSNYSGELTSLMLATKFGHLEIVRLLVEHGATINIYDKKNRSALTYAVINGHSNIVGYFLEIGANPANKDLFGNNLFHYALAYDWHSCFELLLKTNINLKDTNIFGLTPIYAAYWKQHLGFIHYILERNILNVNVPINDTGINLTMLACSMIRPGRTVEHLKMFVEKFKCDLTKTDYEGNNSLHYLLKCEAKYRNSSPTVINEIQNSLNILLRNGFSCK
uniref:Alpha-latrotoxin n=1 Tax=Dermatophagoides pteronyssinus TaxID=6956 RepID=A0A6P6Y6Q5_DERPT|nr:alpha-latrocrustotoxin-Lt1a-like [Dermatophagoides pteronyssinus]